MLAVHPDIIPYANLENSVLMAFQFALESESRHLRKRVRQ